MLAIFSKPIQSLTPADIEELVHESWPEDDRIEFKGSLPEKAGRLHPWMRESTALAGNEDIGNYARDEILSEIVGLANTRGGLVLLGIEESKARPPRATAIAPVPRVADLARRFEDQARVCIDPPLPRLQIRSIETGGRGAGVIVFRVEPSRAAPHRLTANRECYVRRGSSTVRMTMREVQDMTLNVARGLAGIERNFRDRRDAFHQWVLKSSTPLALRLTAIPLADFPDPGRLFALDRLWPTKRTFDAKVGRRTVDIIFPFQLGNEHPCLRGTVKTDNNDGGRCRCEVRQAGSVDLWVKFVPVQHIPGQDAVLRLHHGNILAGVSWVFLLVEGLRHQVGAGSAEYGLELELIQPSTGVGADAAFVGLFSRYGQDQYALPREIDLPRIPMGDRSEFSAVVNAIDTDIYDAMGVRRAAGEAIEIEL